MKPKHTAIRAFGQRSIASSFLSRSSNPFGNAKEDVKDKDKKEISPVSLSDFLDRKLNKPSVPLQTVQGKSSPFSTPVGSKNAGGSTDERASIKKRDEELERDTLDKVIFEQFKHTRAEKGDTPSCPSDTVEVEIANEDSVRESRKRRNPFEGTDEKHTTRKPFVVLGEDSKYKKSRRRSSLSNKRSKPIYNHYANGSGWWDYSMEGVDSEEVGYGDVWEGVGSTTFGGIQWH